MYEVFAQVNRGGGVGAAQQAGALVPAGIFLCFYGAIFVVALGIQIMFLLSLSKCFHQIAKRNRLMEPGQVWLNLIPLFNIVWMILTILRLSDSLRNEYEDRRWEGDDDYGETLGILYFVLSIVCDPVGLACFVMYWVKIAGYTSELKESGRSRPRRNRKYDDDVEDDDDRPRKRRRRSDDDDDL